MTSPETFEMSSLTPVHQLLDNSTPVIFWRYNKPPGITQEDLIELCKNMYHKEQTRVAHQNLRVLALILHTPFAISSKTTGLIIEYKATFRPKAITSQFAFHEALRIYEMHCQHGTESYIFSLGIPFDI